MGPRKKPVVTLGKKAKQKVTSHEGTLTLNEPIRKKPRGRVKVVITLNKKRTDLELKAKQFHVLKRELMAPFLVQLALERHFKELTENLEDEFSVIETSSNEGSPEVAVGDLDLNDTSYQDDWRSG